MLHGVRNANCSWSSVSPVAVNSKCCSAHRAAIRHAAYEPPMCTINTVQRGALGLRLLSMDYPPGGKALTFLKSSHSTGEYGTVRSALGTARASARSAAPAPKLSSGVSARLSCARCKHFEIAELGKQLSMLCQSWSYIQSYCRCAQCDRMRQWQPKQWVVKFGWARTAAASASNSFAGTAGVLVPELPGDFFAGAAFAGAIAATEPRLERSFAAAAGACFGGIPT